MKYSVNIMEEQSSENQIIVKNSLIPDNDEMFYITLKKQYSLMMSESIFLKNEMIKAERELNHIKSFIKTKENEIMQIKEKINFNLEEIKTTRTLSNIIKRRYGEDISPEDISLENISPEDISPKDISSNKIMNESIIPPPMEERNYENIHNERIPSIRITRNKNSKVYKISEIYKGMNEIEKNYKKQNNVKQFRNEDRVKLFPQWKNLDDKQRLNYYSWKSKQSF